MQDMQSSKPSATVSGLLVYAVQTLSGCPAQLRVHSVLTVTMELVQRVSGLDWADKGWAVAVGVAGAR